MERGPSRSAKRLVLWRCSVNGTKPRTFQLRYPVGLYRSREWILRNSGAYLTIISVNEEISGVFRSSFEITNRWPLLFLKRDAIVPRVYQCS